VPVKLSVERREYAFAVTAYEGKKMVGRVGVIKWNPPATPHKTFMRVARIDVDESVRRQGVGTKLYERAARVACEARYDVPLASDTDRSPMSESFWRKQVDKGRARRDDTSRAFYVLSCPAPRSLKGTRR
jgi:GNAT superfamily N-acetyltransferase